MGGMEGIGTVRPVPLQEVKERVIEEVVSSVAGKAAGQATIGDKLHSRIGPGKCPQPFPAYCKFPPTFQRSPEQVAWDLIRPILVSRDGDQAHQEFAKEVKLASTATLRKALDLLDEEENRARRMAPPDHPAVVIDWDAVKREQLKAIKLVRKALETELRTRVEEARKLIRGVSDKSGAEQLEAFVAFTKEIKNTTRVTLEQARYQLIERMANESDPEKRIIYKLMLIAVNKELDIRKGWIHWNLGHMSPLVIPAASDLIVPLELCQEERDLLHVRLLGAGVETRASVKSFLGIKD